MNTSPFQTQSISDSLFMLLCDHADGRLSADSPEYHQVKRLVETVPAVTTVMRSYQDTRDSHTTTQWQSIAAQVCDEQPVRDAARRIGFLPVDLRTYLADVCFAAGRHLQDLLPNGDALEELCVLARRLAMPATHLRLALRACFVPPEPSFALARSIPKESGSNRAEPMNEEAFAMWLDAQELGYPNELQMHLKAALAAL